MNQKMKIKKYFRYFAGLLPLSLLAACASDSVLDDPVVSDEVPAEITLTLTVPPETQVELGTRAADPAVASLTVLCYDKDGKGLSTKRFTTGWQLNNGTYSMTVPIHKLTNSVQVVTNVGADKLPDNSAGAPNLSSIAVSDPAAGVLWGSSKLSNLISNNSKMTLLRANAKASVKMDAADKGFTITGVGAYGTASTGVIAPVSANTLTDASGVVTGVKSPSLPAGVAYTYKSGMKGASDEVAIFETPAQSGSDCARVIVKIKYDGVEGYYPVAFRTREINPTWASQHPGQTPAGSEIDNAYIYTPVPVLRNYHYIVTVKEVRAKGWTSYDEACKAEPDNRLTVEITERDEAITDIIATRDYMLGIGGDVTCDYAAGTVSFDVVTSYTGQLSATSSQSWAHVDGANLQWGNPTAVTGLTSGAHSNGRRFHATLKVDENGSSISSREAVITVSAGELTRSFKVIQLAHDLKRDPRRKVIAEGLGIVVNDYFNWIDNTCKGLLPEQNRGAERNQGLHFASVNNRTMTYKIPKLSGDVKGNVSGGFSVTEQSGYWVVKANNQATPTIEIGSFTVKSANGDIVYPLYRTGVFHELTQSTANWQLPGHEVYGWFYYEVVKVNGHYILDRNLGTSSNAPYTSTAASLRGNVDARGAYMAISRAKSTGSYVSTVLNLSGLKIPTEADVKAWAGDSWTNKLTNVSANGETTKILALSTTGSKVTGNVIYFPHAGYYEGEVPNNEAYVNFWTSSLLTGSQGYSPSSPEYGYWFKMFSATDSYVSNNPFTNMRLCTGVEGEVPNEYSLFRYAPIRLSYN